VDALAGPYAAAALLLILGGLLEVRRPRSATEALAGLGASVPPPVVRVFATSAVLVGVAALVAGGGTGGRIAAGFVGLAYLGFAGFVGLALARAAPLASCGCFGRDDTPPTVTHLVLDLAGAGAALAVVLSPGDGFRGAVEHQPGAGIPFLVVTGVCAGLSYLVFTRAPRIARPDGMRDPRG